MNRLLAVTPEKNPWLMVPPRLKVSAAFNADDSIVITELLVVVIMRPLSGDGTPTLFRKSVLIVPGGAFSVIELTVMLPGKLAAVEWVSWTAFELEFVMKISWPAAGRAPSDQVRSSQLPLVP